jgi:hypothetical protein
LTAVDTAYPSSPFLPFFQQPIELASFRPQARLHHDRRIDLAAICSSTLLYVGVVARCAAL